MTLYEKTVKFVDATFNSERQKRHFERTVYWLERFLPEVGETERIAAYAHDIERGMKGERDHDYLNVELLREHQENGAEAIATFLRQNGADEEMVSKVTHLVRRHEFGGDVFQEALKDADSASYLEVNAEWFVKERARTQGYEKVKGKLDWMFNRMNMERKNLVQEHYVKWSTELERFK